jgi:hypothetical protein
MCATAANTPQLFSSASLTAELPLSNATPGSVYQPSSVLLPRNPIDFVYAHGFTLRTVNNSGDISWHKGRVFISEVFRFEVLGFEQVDEDFYRVYFRDVEIGEFDAEALRFRPVQVIKPVLRPTCRETSIDLKASRSALHCNR